MSTRVLGVLNGRDMPIEHVLKWAVSAETVYAADGAARPLVESCMAPVLVGDMDSWKGGVPRGIRVVGHPEDQDTTDCDKLLQAALDDGVKHLTLTGIEGDRLDHVLSSLHSCVKSPLNIRVILRRGIGTVVRAGASQWPTSPGQRLSLLPLQKSVGVCLTGVEWPLDHAELESGVMVSISNVATAEKVSVEMKSGACLLIRELERGFEPFWEEID